MTAHGKPARFLLGVQLCAVAALAQTAPRFGPADVHVSAHTANAFMRGPFLRAGRYEIRNATMVDLVRTAWGVDEDRVAGGPAWLETDRFDISAKLPGDITPDSLRLALQALLEDRFGLVAHPDSRPMQAYLLTAGKKPLLKEAAGSGESGCRNTTQGGGRGNAPPMLTFSCANTTMAAFATAITSLGALALYLNGSPVVDRTGLNGSWDFEFRVSRPNFAGVAPDTEAVTVFDALEKQLGLKLQLEKTSLPVVVVDSVNQKPTANPPGLAESLPPAPAEFEVADVKPSDPSGGGLMNFQIQPNGRVNLQGVTMMLLIREAYSLSGNLNNVAGAPKWVDTDRFDIIAKVQAVASPAAAGGAAGPVDTDSVWLALRALLADRFKLAVHFEDQPLPVYALVATKPKLTRADPANRSSCKSPNLLRVLTGFGQNRSNSDTLTCQNTTMEQLAEKLQQLSVGDVDHPVVDNTGLEGAWDFTLTWTPAIVGEIVANRARGGGDAAAGASDPTGGVSMAQALEKQLGLKLEPQKRPLPVLVIDHVEEKPTDN